jgi:hypothetical protein
MWVRHPQSRWVRCEGTFSTDLSLVWRRCKEFCVSGECKYVTLRHHQEMMSRHAALTVQCHPCLESRAAPSPLDRGTSRWLLAPSGEYSRVQSYTHATFFTDRCSAMGDSRVAVTPVRGGRVSLSSGAVKKQSSMLHSLDRGVSSGSRIELELPAWTYNSLCCAHTHTHTYACHEHEHAMNAHEHVPLVAGASNESL